MYKYPGGDYSGERGRQQKGIYGIASYHWLISIDVGTFSAQLLYGRPLQHQFLYIQSHVNQLAFYEMGRTPLTVLSDEDKWVL